MTDETGYGYQSSSLTKEPTDTIIPVRTGRERGVDWMALTCDKCGHMSKIGNPVPRRPGEEWAAIRRVLSVSGVIDDAGLSEDSVKHLVDQIIAARGS